MSRTEKTELQREDQQTIVRLLRNHEYHPLVAAALILDILAPTLVAGAKMDRKDAYKVLDEAIRVLQVNFKHALERWREREMETNETSKTAT